MVVVGVVMVDLFVGVVVVVIVVVMIGSDVCTTAACHESLSLFRLDSACGKTETA